MAHNQNPSTMQRVRTYLRAHGVTDFIDGIGGIHFMMRVKHHPNPRECWLTYDGKATLELRALIGPKLGVEEREMLVRALRSVAEGPTGLMGVPDFGEDAVRVTFFAQYLPSHGGLDELLDALFDAFLPHALARLDLLYGCAILHQSPQEIVENYMQFAFPEGDA